MSWKEDPPTIIEHTTVQPTVERNTIIERDNWYSEPWAIALVIGAIAIVALVAYWALYTPNPTVVSSTTIERQVPDGRAQTINPPANPPVIVNPPASPPPTVNVNPPANNNSNPPVIINNTPSNPPANGNGTGSGSNNGAETSGASGSGNSTTGQ